MANFILRKAEPKDVPDILRLIKVDFTLVYTYGYFKVKYVRLICCDYALKKKKKNFLNR